jgi:nitric oxide reductase large subunit
MPSVGDAVGAMLSGAVGVVIGMLLFLPNSSLHKSQVNGMWRIHRRRYAREGTTWEDVVRWVRVGGICFAAMGAFIMVLGALNLFHIVFG